MFPNILLILCFIQTLYADSWNSVDGYGMKSFVRGVSSVSQKFTIDMSDFQDAMIVGYFKPYSFTSSVSFSMMRLQVSDEYTFMNYYLWGSSPYILCFMDANNDYFDKQQGPSVSAGNWYQFGLGYKQSTNTYYAIWQNNYVYYADYNYKNFQLRSDITQLTLCLICPPLEYKFTQFDGIYASIKMITGFTPQNINQYQYISLINESSMTFSQLNQAFLNNTDLANYLKNQLKPLTNNYNFNCLNTTKVYFDGVCIDPSQCANTVYFKTSIFGSINSVFYNQIKQNCDVCQDNCQTCDNQSNCLQCNYGYFLDSSSNLCKKCPASTFYNPMNSLCVSKCPSGYQQDKINQICVQSFNPFYILLNPLLNPKNFIQNEGFVLMDSSSNVVQQDQFTQCWLENVSFGPYSILGGKNNLNTFTLSKKILNLPKNFQKIITFQGLIYNNGNQGDFILIVNNNQIPLSSYNKTFQQQQLCNDNQLVNYYQLTYIISDSTTDLDITISSNKNGWGIRNFSMNITKCHSTCNDCTTDGNPWSCTTCQMQLTSIQVNNNCACKKGQYTKFQNCYSSPCYACSDCPPNCLSCEDQTGKCTSCSTGYSVQNGLCAINSSCSNQYTNDPGSSYCIRKKDQNMSFFMLDRIQIDLQFWQFSTGLPEQYHQCYTRKYAPYIYGSQSFSLNMQLQQYQIYHQQVEFQLTATNIDTFQPQDYISYFVDNNLIKKANYQTNSTVSLCQNQNAGEALVYESIISYKKDSKLNFTIGGYLSSSWYTFNDLTIYYIRCHASCSNCLNESSCSQCIQNAQPNAAKGNFCYCNDGFYFTYDWNTSSGLCLPCNSFCKTCNGPSITDCLTCQESYAVVNNICVSACKANQFWDFSKHQCIDCSDCCATCSGTSNQQCLSCQNSIMTLSSSVCQFNQDNRTCNSCNTNVVNSLCGGSQVNHDYCVSQGWLSYNKNTCVNCYTADSSGNCGGGSLYNQLCNKYGYYYSVSQGQCLSCSSAIQGVCGDPSISSVCKQNRWIYESLSTCISCNLKQSPLCCDPTCSTCNGSNANNCLSCYGSMILFNNTCLDKCPNGYSYDPITNSCQVCSAFVGVPACNSCASDCQTCSAATISQCKTCYGSRKLNSNTNRCECQDNEDQRNFFYECSINNQAVLDIQLSNTGPSMTIDFGKILTDLPQFPIQTSSNSVCQVLFSQKELLKIGLNAIYNTATIMQGDNLNFLPNVLKFKINSNSTIDTFLNNVVYQKAPNNTGVVFIYNKIENSCNDYKITLDKVLNDSGRGFKNITWSLLNPTTNQDDIKIQTILSQATSQNLVNVLIPKGIIALNTPKNIQVNYWMKNTYYGTQQFLFQVQTFKSIGASVSTDMTVPFYSNAVSLNANDPVDIQITSPQTQLITASYKSYVQNVLVQNIVGYSFPAHSQNLINIQLQLSSDQTVINSLQISFSSESPNLMVKVVGGNQKIDYKTQLNLHANIRDLDVQDPDVDQGITLIWTCSDPSDPTKQCIDQSANPFIINSNNPLIPADTFNPYTVIRIQAQAKKDTRSSQDFVIVLFTEFDLPLLDVSLNLIDPLGITVNLNEEIYVSLNYDTKVNPDILSFSSTLVYQNEPVGAIKFDYTKLKFQLWDHYSSFNRQNPSVTIRFSVFNPYYFMPSVSIVSLKLNFPPDQCIFNITPLPNSSNIGYSLKTTFNLAMSNCIDDNLPIQYQFFMYKSSDDLKYEIQNPQQVTRRQLNDLSQNSSLQTILPTGNLVIMATASDSKLAVYNTTIIISVTNSNLGEAEYIATIDTVLNNNQLAAQQIISELSLIAEDLCQRSDLLSSDQINQRKIQIINKLQNSALLLPTQSTFSSLSNKAIQSLMSTVKLTSDQQSEQLKNIQSSLSEDWSLVPYQSLSMAVKSQRNQQIHDFFQIVDKMANNTQSQNSTISDLQIDISNKLTEKMNYNALPNEDPKIFQGGSLKLQSQIVSEKNLCKYLFCTDYEPSDAQNKPIIYSIGYKTYNQNPYLNDQSFQNFTQQIQQNIGNMTLAQFPVINPTITPSSTPQPGSLINVSNSVLTFQATQQQQGLACFTKAKNQWTQSGCKLVFNSKSNQYTCLCESLGPTTVVNDLQALLQNKNLKTAFGEQGYNNITHFTEFYKYIAFWLILFETFGFLFLYLKGRSLDKIYENQQNLFANTNQNKIFPADSNSIKDSDHIFSNIQQQQQKQQSQKQNSQEDQQSKQQEKDCQQILLTEQAIFKPKKKIRNINSSNCIKPNNQENQMKVTQFKREVQKKQLSQKDVLNLDFPNLNDDKGSFQNLENILSQRKSNPENKNLFSSNQFKGFETNVMNLDTQAQNNEQISKSNDNNKQTPSIDQLINQDNKDSQKTDNKIQPITQNGPAKKKKTLNQKKVTDLSEYSSKTQKFRQFSFFKQILFFHNFFGIFCVYDKDMPRSLRFSCFYVRLIHSFAISVIFDQSLSIVQVVALSIANAMIIMTCLKLLELVTKKIGRCTTAFVLISLLAFYYYVVLAVVSGQQISTSNLSMHFYATWYPIEGFGMKSLVRGVGYTPQSLIIQQQDFQDAIIFGYFKFNTIDPTKYYSMMRYQVSQEYTFMNYYTIGTSPYIMIQMDNNNQMINSQQGPGIIAGQWYQFGFGFKQSLNTYYAIWQGYPQGGLVYPTYVQSNFQFRSDITQLILCIICPPLENKFTQFAGSYSSIKMIKGFYPPDTAKLIINESKMNDLQLRSAFFINSDSVNYTKAQYLPLTTDLSVSCYNSTKFYFDGVCIDLSQCQNIVYYQTTQFGLANSVFYNSIKSKCDVCQDYCLTCDNQSNCLSCSTGYVLDTSNNICKRCPVNSFYNPLNSLCVSNCPNGYQKDYINQLCVQSFNPFYILLNPLLYPRNFIQNDGFTLMDTNSQVQPNQYTQCWLENQSFGPYTILGGQNNLSTNKINKKILNLPKNFQKIITFQGLIYNNGQQGDFILMVNNNLVTLSSYTKTFTNYQLCDDNQSVNYYQLTYIINDSTTDLDINISTTKNGWGIRNFAMNITKCHSTCNDCTIDGNPWSCTTCQIQQTSLQINKNCACNKGQYTQFQNCYSSPCYACANCPPNCLSCEDQTGKCTSCATGYSIQNGLCAINSSCINQYSQDPGSSYCIRAKDQGMSFFVQDRIQIDLQFWQYTGLPEQFRQCYNRKYAPYIYGTQSVSLIMQLPNYQKYHYQVEFKFTAMNVDNFAAIDYMSYYIDNNLVKKANYRSNSTVSLCEDVNYGETLVPEDIFQLKKDTNLNFTLGAYLPNSKWFTLNDLTILYQRCHASCTNCLDGSSCTSCIQNSQPNAALGNFCYCNDGFYFTYDWNTSSGLCIPCNNFCKTCNGPSITDCITCQESFKIVNNICVSACQKNQFWDFNAHQCINCSDCCSSCNDISSSNCLSCQDTIMTLSSTVCKFNSDQSTCNSCNSNVSNSLCGGTQINHNYCISKGWVSYNSNTCVNCFNADSNGNCGGGSLYNQLCNKYGYYYSSTSQQCLSCSQAIGLNCGDPSISSVCKQNKWVYQSLSTCISCNLQQSPLCCDAICNTCNGSSANNCLSCYGSMVLFNSSCLDKCPNGYSYNASQNNCQSCTQFIGVSECNNCASDCQTCSAATISQCKTCYSSRQFNPATNRCDCKDQEDQRSFFYECSINNQAVLNIQLSNSGPQMTIDFGKILADLPNFPTQTNSNSICKLLFNQTELLKIGLNASCQIQFNIINIVLDNTATIMQGDTLNFLPNVLKFKINTSSYIDTFLNNIVYQQTPQNTGVIFTFKKIENSCNDYKITLEKVSNDSGRGFKSITWTLLNPTTNQDDVKIQNILSQASSQNLLNIIIPKGVITLNTQKNIQASYILKNTYSASQQFVFQVQTFKSITSVLSTDMVIPYFRYLEFNLNLSYSIQYCDSQGNSLNANDPIDINIASPQTAQVNKQIKNNTQNQISLIIQAYSFPPSSDNMINVQLQLSSDSTVTNIQQVQFSTVPPKLNVKTTCGNQKIDYKSNLNLNANTRDLDVQDPNADQGINITWSCTDPSDPTKQCYDQTAKPFNINQISPSIPPSTFSPYTVIRIQAQANKDTRSSLDFIIVLFTEFDLPLLNVSINLLDPQGVTVNLNEEIYATLNYNTTVNTDILSFSSTLVYQNESVGAIKFDYTKLKFQLWDHYSAFNRQNPSLSIRFSVFNPYFYMPSVSIMSFQINFPPDQCNFTIKPLPTSSNVVYSLKTMFNLQMSNCVDDNLPIMYQFFMYKSQSDLNLEKLDSKQITRRQLNDQQQDSNLSTILPSGNLIIMATASDSKQAIFNTTISINVSNSVMDETQYIQTIDQVLNNSQLTNQQIVSELSLIAEDLSLRTDLASSDQINQKKIQILDTLKKVTLMLPSSSTFSSLSNKAIASLVSSIQLTSEQENDQLTSLQSALSQDWSQVPYQTLSVTEKSQRNQQIYDYFKILDNMVNSTQSVNSTISNLQLDISNKLGDKMNYNALPNEDPKTFEGNNIKIQSQQVTEKNLCNYLFCSNYIPSNTQTQSIFYNIAYKTYEQNPYLNDPSYQNLTQQIQQNIGNQTTVSFSVINPSILPSSKPSQDSVINSSNSMYNFQGKQSQKEGLACYTKNKDQWTQSGCKLVFNSKNNQYTCFCESLGPTTIANDLQSLIQNKNLQTAFGKQGFENISHFSDFYEYIAFWLIVCKTIGFILLYVKGKRLDKKFEQQQDKVVSTNFSQRQVVPLPLNLKSIQDSKQSFKHPQKNQSGDKSPFSFDQTTKNKLQSNTKNKFFYSQNQIKDEQYEIQQENNQIYQQTEEQELKKNSNQDEQIRLQQKQSSLNQIEDSNTPRKVEEQLSKADNKSIFSKQQIINIRNEDQKKNGQKLDDNKDLIQNKLPSIDDLCQQQAVQLDTKENRSIIQNSNKNIIASSKFITDLTQFSYKTQKFIQFRYLKQILFFHNFFGIFLVYDKEMSRPLRFSCFYVRLIHSFAISIIFNQSLSIVQLIAVSIANAIIIMTCLKLLEIVAKKFTRYALAFILISLLAFYYYIILSIISGQQVGSSNWSMLTYLAFTLFDLLVVSFLSAIIQRYFAIKMIKKQQLQNCSQKLYELLHLQLILTSVR